MEPECTKLENDQIENKEPNEIERKKYLEDFKILLQEIELKNNLKCNKEDWFLMRFLYTAKFDLKKAAQIVINYYKLFNDNPDMFKDFKPSELNKNIKDAGKINYFLSGRDKLGRGILVVSSEFWDITIHKVKELFRNTVLYLEELSRSEETQNNGVVVIVNYKNFSHRHLWGFIPYIKRLSMLMQGSFPLKVKQIHIVNQPAIYDVFYKIISIFLLEKMKKRFILHGNDKESLLKHVDKQILPPCLGGESTEDFARDLFPNVLLNEEYFQNFTNFGFKEVK